MYLEDLLNATNEYYINKDIALIYKKPTPIQIVSTSSDKKYITKAYFKEKSTTDYNGIYKGKYIDFEAKECNLKTSFPFKNIKDYQLSHLKKVQEHGGIAFIIFYFSLLETFYLVYIDDILNYMNLTKRTSFPISFFKKFGHEIKETNILDYLKIIDSY